MDNITQRLNERLSDRPDPSEAQKSAGNYPKGLVYINGMRVSIENPAGSIRKGKDQDGNEWESELKHHYGYIRGTTGRDKDHIDAFLASGGSVGSSDRVHVIDQVDPKTGRFDEHKVILGAKDKDHAADTYLANYPEDWDGFGEVTEMPLKAFKQWAFQPGRRVKALSSEVHDNHVKAKSMPKFAEGGSVLGALKDNQFWKDVMSNASDMTQAASNSVAGNVAGPVDLINWALKKAGAGSQKPVLGSDWLKDKGLMRDVPHGLPSVVGETLGLLAPMGMIDGAPKVARALNKGMENLAAPRVLNPETGAIVYHGSPHKFDKFDASKIGTGEGAQAYGHGLYLAESPDVAKGYRSKLSDPTIDSVKADLYTIAGDPKWSVQAFDVNGKVVPKTKGYLDPQDIEKHYGKVVADKVLASEYGGHFKGLGVEDGALYKVDLPDEHIAKMLDWDKPLSQQPKDVQAALAKVKPDQYHPSSGDYDPMELGQMVHQRLTNDDKFLGIQPGARMSGAPGWTSGLVTEKLRDAGIPGIRYLDGGSRGAGEGTSNFVVFPGNEHMLNILERNGQPVQKKFTYPQDAALETARQNGVKMLGLPENNTAEMRARAMGFDLDRFHGTKGDKDWAGIDAFDIGKANEGLYGKGVYTTTSPAIAGGGKGNTVAPQGYATNEGLNHLMTREGEASKELAQVKQTLSKVIADGDSAKTTMFQNWAGDLEGELKGFGNWKTGGGAVYPLAVRNPTPFNPDKMKLKRGDLTKEMVNQIEDQMHSVGKNPKGKWPMSYGVLDSSVGGPSEANKLLQELGYSGIQHNGGVITGVPIKHTVDMAFNPNQVRSRFAAFDPARRNEPDLLAGAAPLMLLNEDVRDQLPGFATGGSVPSGPAYGDRENGYFNADGSQYKPVTTRAATDADKSTWTLNAADVDSLLTDDAMGGGRSWTYQDGQPHADLTLSGGKKWNPSGAASGIKFHKKGDPIYDQSQQPSADAGGPVSSGQYEQDTYDISGDLSAMTGKPGSNLHTNIQYQKVGDKLVPINSPDYWDWAVNNRATNGEFVQALSMMAPAIGGIMTSAGVGALTAGESAALAAGKGALMSPSDPLKGAAVGAAGSYIPGAVGATLGDVPDFVKGAAVGGLTSAATGGNPLVGMVSGATGSALKDFTGNDFITKIGTSIAAAGMASGKTPDQVIRGLLQNPTSLLKALIKWTK